jgi:hypothetical protein
LEQKIEVQMASRLIVSLPNKVLEKIEKRAEAENRPINDLVVDVLQNTFNGMPDNPENEAMEREMAAYQTMHPQLLSQYKNQYVAILDGRLVDHDTNQLALVKRRLQKYPNQTVLITQVRPEPIRTIQIRSPRLLKPTS